MIGAADAVQVIGLGFVALSFVIAVGSAAFIRSQTSGTKESVELFETSNAELRNIVEDKQRQIDEMRQKQKDDNAECERRLHDQEVAYTSKIAKLEGKVEVLSSEVVAKLVDATIAAARKELENGR